MRRNLLFISSILFLFALCSRANAQTNQTVANGASTNAVNFTGSGCTYNWVNDSPGIGLASSGTGNIPSFTAINYGSTPIKATITAKPSTAGVAYIGNVAGSNVLAIDVVTHKTIASIPVGNKPWGVAVSPDGSRVYTTNYDDNTVSVINAITNKILATILVGINPTGLVVSPDGSKVYVANTNSTSSASISVINTADNTVSNINAGTTPVGIAISADGSTLFVGDEQTATLYIINTSTKQIVNTSFTGAGPYGVAVNPASTFVYTANFASGTVSVINAATGQFVTNINTGANPIGIVVSPDGSTVYVANTGASNVSVINAANNQVVATIPVGHPVAGVSLNADGSQLFVANENTTFLTVINTATNSITADINTGISAISMGNFITGGSDCAIAKFTITVSPASLPPAITASAATGNISACVGSASASPDIQQFTISGSNLTNGITATAPANFEVSLSPATGYSNSLTLPQSGGKISNTIVYVRSSASASAGSISGNVVLSSIGAISQNVAVSGMVHALPTINTVPNQTVPNQTLTAPVNFSGTGNGYSWTNDSPTIGLGSYGLGNIPAFYTKNQGTSPITAKVTVTPLNSAYAYITNFNDNDVSVINTGTNAIVATINVGTGPSDVASSPDGSLVYITNYTSNNVSVINTSTNTLTATIPAGMNPQGIVISPDGSRLYVANKGSNNISVINTATNAVVATILSGFNPIGIAISPDGSKVYVANAGSGTISVISTANNTVLNPITVGTYPSYICLNADGSILYVTNFNSGTVSVINTATGIVTASINTAPEPIGIAISPDGSTLYVSNAGSGGISVINTSTNMVTANIQSRGYADGVALTPDGSLLYVVNESSGIVQVISTATNNEVYEINVGSGPTSFGNFMVGGSVCSGIPKTFTITVNAPTALIQPTSIPNTVYSCSGSPTPTATMQIFYVYGSNLTSDVNVTAPAGFEISSFQTGPFSQSLVMSHGGGNIGGDPVFVRLAAADAVGNLSGNIVLSSAGAVTQNVAVRGVVSGIPTANNVVNQTVLNGGSTAPINFTGTANTYNWVNDTPTIGLAASGAGDIASFTAVNMGTAPVTAAVTVTPTESSFAYIANKGDNTVSVLNTATKTTATTIKVGAQPEGVSVSPDGSLVYVANGGDGTVSVINTFTNTVTVTVKVGAQPLGVAVSPDGSTVFVANSGDGTVSVINAATNIVTYTIPVGSQPTAVTVSADGSKVYVTNFSAGTLSVISTATHTVTATINVGPNPTGIVLSPDGSHLYVGDNGNYISVITTADNAIVAKASLGLSYQEEPYALTISPDGKVVYIACGNFSVGEFSTITNSVLGFVALQAYGAIGLSLSADGNFLYVTNGSNSIEIVDANDRSFGIGDVLGYIPAGSNADSFGNFIKAGTGCDGNPFKFTITVKPAIIKTNINPGAVTGTIVACEGSASVSPDIQQFTVTGSGLSSDITATAPANFEVSLNAASGYGNSVTLTQSGGAVSSTVIYVRSSASAAVGSISGNVVLSSGATNQNVAVSGTVNPLPAVNTVANQTVTNGTATTAINFTGIGNTFSWTNNTPAIGLAASGTGNIASFTAVNTGGSPVIAKVTVMPSFAGIAYIGNFGSNNITAINTTTNSVIATIAVGNAPYGVTVSPDYSHVYVTNTGDNSVSVISTATDKVTATIPVGTYPTAIAVSPDGGHIYVTNSQTNTVSVINTATNAVTTIIVGQSPEGVVVSPDGTRAYVTNANPNTVSVINTATGTVINTINVGDDPHGIAISPDGSKVYVVNDNSQSISVINTASNAVSTIAVGQEPVGIAVSPDGTRVYVTNQNSNSLSVINTANNSVIKTVKTSANPYGVSVSPDGSMVFVVNLNANNVSVINSSNNTVTDSVAVGTTPVGFGNFVAPASPCSGAPVTFTITVKPIIPASITAGTVTGAISACQGTASFAPNIQQFTVSASGLTGNITATAPTNFEVSLSTGSGYGNSVTLPPSGGTVTGAVIYIRSSASAPAGNIAGDVILTSAGVANQYAAVNGFIKTLPTVNTVGNQSVTNGGGTTAVNFTGTSNTYTWVNDTPGIGLPASGVGNIPSFNAVNTGNTPITATITATPVSASMAYVAGSGVNAPISVINLVTNSVVATINNIGQSTIGVVVSPDGSRVYLTNQASSSVTVINTATNTIVKTITGIQQATGIVITPDGSTLYVTNSSFIDNVSVISTATNSVIANIPVGVDAFGAAITPDGQTVYVTNSYDNTVSVINTSTNKVIATIPVGAAPGELITSRDGSQVFVANSPDGTVSVINTSTNKVTAIIPVGTGPDGLITSNDDSQIFVTNYADNTVSVINRATNAVVKTIPVDKGPAGLFITPDSKYVYVVNNQSNTVSVINTATDIVEQSINVAASPYSYGDFITNGGCNGEPITFTITVKPTLTPLSITASALVGNIIACEGTASASPYIAQSTITASGLSGDVTATAPANFEISLSANGGYGNSVTLTQTNGAINNTVIYIRSAASAPAGSILGDVVLTLAGVNIQNIPVKGFINALPTISAGFNQTVVSGTSTSPINFTGTGNLYTWTNDMPGIGLPASGTGSIPSIIVANNTSSPITATITATPEYAGYAYITNENENTVSVINTTTHAIDYNIAVGKGPIGVAVSPDGSHVYVTNQKDNTISVISTLSNTVTATFNVNSFSPTGITVSPDGGKLYVVELNSNLVSVINATNGAVITTINVGGYPIGVAVSPNGSRLYVANSSSSVSVIDASSNTVITTIPVAKGPYGITVSPDGSKVYLTNYDANVITIIAAATNTILTTVPVGSDPTGVTVSPDGSRVYVTNQNDKTLSVINTATNAVVTTIPIGTNPFGVSVSPDGSQVYVANNASNNVSVINTATNTLITTVPVSFGPAALGNFITAGTGCSGLPVTYTITIDPPGTVLTPNISATGTLQPLVTTYGTPSSKTQFTVTGSNMTGSILVTPPPGFEVSTNGVNFSNTASFGSAGNSISEIFVRLAATTPVGNYSGNIVLTAAGAANVNMPTVLSLVNPAPLTIFADNKTKVYGSDNPVLTVTYSGFVNGENEAVLTTMPVISTVATAASAPGAYTIIVSGAAAANYTITYINGILTITPGAMVALVIPNTFTPNGDGINDTWEIKNIENYPNCKVDIYNRWGEKLYSSIGYPIPWDGKYKGVYLPSGTYYYIINTELNRNVIAGWVAIIK